MGRDPRLCTPSHSCSYGILMLIEPQHQQAPWTGFHVSQRLWTNGVFYALWVFVLFVSVFDTLLTIHLEDEVMQSELNPVGRALLYLNAGQVGYLVAAKGVGT